MSGLIRYVKQEFDWDGYVRAHHTVKNTASDELRVCCVNCLDQKFKLYINPSKGVFFCQKCVFNAKNFDLFDFVAKTEGITRGQAISRLIREYAKTTPDDLVDAVNARMGEEDTVPIRMVNGIKTLSQMPSELSVLVEPTPDNQQFWDYLKGRGLTDSEIQAVKFHYTTASDCPVYDSVGKYRGNLANRIIVPIYGGDNDLVSWQGRVISGNDPMKYLSAPESEMAKTVWPYVRPREKHCVLVEGIYDALSVLRTGRVVYATFTKKISIEQITRLKLWGIEQVTLFWDKRDAGKEMIKAVSDLHMHFRKVYVCNLDEWPTELDAGNMLAVADGTDKLNKVLENTVDTYDTLEFVKWQVKAREWS